MAIVSISPKLQVVIPKAIREALKLKPGQKVQMIQYKGQIVIIPVRSIESMRGFLKGVDTTIEREADRTASTALNSKAVRKQRDKGSRD